MSSCLWQKNEKEQTQSGKQFSSFSLHHIFKDSLAKDSDMAESRVEGEAVPTHENGRGLQGHMAKGMNAEMSE